MHTLMPVIIQASSDKERHRATHPSDERSHARKYATDSFDELRNARTVCCITPGVFLEGANVCAEACGHILLNVGRMVVDRTPTK
eukprot:12738660-Alexandrium_andersonii.AAC.1